MDRLNCWCHFWWIWQGFSKSSAFFTPKSGFKGLKTGCNMSGMMYIVYLYIIECLQIIFMAIIMIFMIMINLPNWQFACLIEPKCRHAWNHACPANFFAWSKSYMSRLVWKYWCWPILGLLCYTAKWACGGRQIRVNDWTGSYAVFSLYLFNQLSLLCTCYGSPPSSAQSLKKMHFLEALAG